MTLSQSVCTCNFLHAFRNLRGDHSIKTISLHIPTEQLRSAGFGLHPFLVHTALSLSCGTRPELHLKNTSEPSVVSVYLSRDPFHGATGGPQSTRQNRNVQSYITLFYLFSTHRYVICTIVRHNIIAKKISIILPSLSSEHILK